MNNTKKGWTISHVNVRSLVRNFDETFVTMNGYDVICISESWLHEKISDSTIEFEGYNMFRQDRGRDDAIIKKRGGGLVVYIKNNLAPYSNSLVIQNKVTTNLEQLWIEITKPHYKRQIICAVYRPPSGKIAEFIQELSDNIDNLESNNSTFELTLIGDFNINYRKSNTPECKTLNESII